MSQALVERETPARDSFEDCGHCGEVVWDHQDKAECEHGICHAECVVQSGCEVA